MCTNYLETDGQRIVSHEQLDIVARSQQLHDRFLVRCGRHIIAVHLQDAVAHAQFARVGRNAAGDDLERNGQTEIINIYIVYVCTYMAYST